VSHSETLLVAESLAQTRDARCLDYLEQLRGFDPVDALLVEAFYRAYSGDAAAAASLVERGFELQRSWPWGDESVIAQGYLVADTLVRSGDAASVARLAKFFLEPFAVERTEERRKLFLLAAAVRFEQERCGPRTLAALELFEPETPWLRDFLARRARCYALAGHPLAALAQSELEQFERNEAKPFGEDLKKPGAAMER
jgi:hypothetical protein